MNTKITRKDQTKNRIMQCFWKLFREKSVDKITVSELTALAKINRSTFYSHFKDVYDVLDQIEEQYLPNGIAFFTHCHDMEDKESLYHSFLKLFDDNYQDLVFLLSDQGDPNFVIKMKNYARPVFKNAVALKYQQNKFFDLTIEYVLSSMISVITYWANHPTEISSDELFNYLHDLYAKGIPRTMKLALDNE